MAEKTVATTVQLPPQNAPLAPYGVSEGLVASAVVIVTGLASGILLLRSRVSKTGVQIHGDDAAKKMIDSAREGEKRAQEERDRAVAETREVYAKYNADQRRMGELEASNTFLASELREARDQLAKIRNGVMAVGQTVDATKNKLDKAERRLGESGITPLGKD